MVSGRNERKYKGWSDKGKKFLVETTSLVKTTTISNNSDGGRDDYGNGDNDEDEDCDGDGDDDDGGDGGGGENNNQRRRRGERTMATTMTTIFDDSGKEREARAMTT